MLANQVNPLELLIGKLGRLADLDEAATAAVRALPFRVARVLKKHILVREGDRPTDCCVLLRGFTCRYKVTSEGERQIVSFHMAGDVLDAQHLLLERADHSAMAITDASVAWVPAGAIREVLTAHSSINHALWRDTLIDGSIFREWVLNVGRRDSKTRIAHMLCEFVTRMEAAGLGSPQQFELPMTQHDIADATGLTSVHVNRTLQVMEQDGVIERKVRHFRIVDWQRMQQVADFDPAYLHVAAA